MFKSKLSRTLVRYGIIATVPYFGLLLFVFFTQRNFIYHPSHAPLDVLTKIAAEQNFKPWQTDSGEFIGWKHVGKSRRKHGRLLIVHGNAGSAIDRLGYANTLTNFEPMDVYILEYPGFGARPGSPSQQSFFAAASEAVELLKDKGPLHIMGESLGTGVAAYIAGTYPDTIRGMLLAAPYDNFTEVAQQHMPIFPVNWMLWDRFPSESYLTNYHGPVAMLFAGEDAIVPNRFGHQLYDAYQGPKIFWEIPGVGHNDLLDQPAAWWSDVAAFWRTNSVGTAPDPALAPSPSDQ